MICKQCQIVLIHTVCRKRNFAMIKHLTFKFNKIESVFKKFNDIFDKINYRETINRLL